MNRRVHAAFLAFILLGTMLAPVVALVDHHSDSVKVSGDHPAPCPDRSGGEDPCSDNCNCLCCPGHLRVLPASQALSWCRIDLVVHRFASSEWERLPDGFNQRVFHPPRSI